ncbi:MAG: SixA phosphatase family protein, partial [Oceanihabitans sp.]
LLVSSYIKNKIRKPQAIYTSTANRAKTTANLFIENLEWNNLPYLEKDKLYDFSGNDLVNEIKNFPSNIEHIIVFGHNHAITAIVNTFGSIRFNNVPTCGLVQIEFSIINWEDLNKGKTTFHIFPKLLKQAL